MSKQENTDKDKDEEVKSTKKHKNRWWLIALAVEILIIIGIVVVYVNNYINNRIGKIEHVELNETKVNEELDEQTVQRMTGYTNIALFGIDTRDAGMEETGVRSDAILICSINNDTKQVKLVSVYRDTYLELANEYKTYEKATHAYAYGGAQGAVNMLNKNLDLNINEYVSVNFTALTEAIDALGGIDVELKYSELDKLNECIDEQMGINGIMSDYVYETGVVHLNGVQATAYSRIRSTDEGDITRTWRQRYVIQKMIEAAKSAGLSKLMDCIDVVVDDISSSLSKDEIMKLAKDCFDYDISTTTGFPFTYSAPMINEASVVVAADLETNVIMLHRFLYDDMDYQPTPTVKNISANVISDSGTYNTLDLSTFKVEDDVDSICEE
ncbi:MAG: LCP family protein [Coprococcus sp.]